ncbi:MAG: glycosyltransferase [Phycisphaeraceae bacterium]|nr:glycosyltransferase [Phycisphaeraceae bacterium]
MTADPTVNPVPAPDPATAEDEAGDLAPGSRAAGPALVLEFAWEVCNQVGGIYQVIRSKAPEMVARWGDRYVAVGPYEGAKADLEFEMMRGAGWVGRALTQLREQHGVTIHHGRWLIPGRPRVMLLDHSSLRDRLGDVKYRLWRDHGIETPGGDGLIDGVVTFAEASRLLVEALCNERALVPGRNKGVSRMVVAHFHEWMGGLAIPMIRRARLPAATLFTTHATLLGRYMASSEDGFYDWLPWVDQDKSATQYNVRAQHSIERACAHGSHVFTTVSSITAEECAHLLGRPIDLVTPNGLNVAHYNKVHNQQRFHGEFKQALHRFVCGYFFPSYSFDLDNTLYFFTSGRYEPRNKGFDLCLEAMARLNAELKAARLGKTVVFFIVSRRATKSINPLAMEKRGVLNELEEVCEHITKGVMEQLFWRAASGGRLKLDDLVDEYWMLRYRRAQQAMKQHCLPMVVTHILEDDQNDPVLNQIRMLGLHNTREDPVKVVYHPDFISPTNRLWGVDYDQFVRGCHLGVFPSAYEPWGYTPLECLAMGIPAVTSDLAGFGRYVQEQHQDHDQWGLTVLPRRRRGYFDAAADLAQRLLAFCKLDRRQRIALRNEVDRHSWEFDWSRLAAAYHRAHDLAIDRAARELDQDPHP